MDTKAEPKGMEIISDSKIAPWTYEKAAVLYARQGGSSQPGVGKLAATHEKGHLPLLRRTYVGNHGVTHGHHGCTTSSNQLKSAREPQGAQRQSLRQPT